MREAWGKFWRLSPWVKWPVIAFVALVLLGIVGNLSGDQDEKRQASAPTASGPDTAARTAWPVLTQAPAQAAAQPAAAPTPAPTPEPTPPPPPAPTPPPPMPIVLSGRGQTATMPFTLPRAVSIATFRHMGTRNFIVKAHQDGKETLLINTIGAYQGARPLNGTAPITLDIQADGAWAVEIAAIEPAPGPAFSGRGDAVSGLFQPPRNGPWEITHSGMRNFIVWLRCAGGDSLVQNMVGMTSGSRVVTFRNGPCLWDVQADGEWSLAPR